MPAYLSPHHSDLCHAIATAIQQHPDRRISFAEFMNLALYHPQHGYYNRSHSIIGKKGDFVTAPHLSADFGELLAELMRQLWVSLGCPKSFTVMEVGAGQGILARDLLRGLQQIDSECFDAISYWIIEQSRTMQQVQRSQLTEFEPYDCIRWRTWDEIPSQSIIGCCFSNELVDAFPVHRVRVHENALQEIYVTQQDNEQVPFAEVLAPLSTPAIADYFEHYRQAEGINLLSDAYGEGYETEVNLAAIDWLKTVSDRLKRGYLLTIDYGYTAQRYYNSHRRSGTLQCYYQQSHHSNPYYAIGHQDLTAHADFTALEHYGNQFGLGTVGFTQQALLMMALGLGDRLAVLSQPGGVSDVQTLFNRRQALHGLIDPMGLGNFGVLMQQKGVLVSEYQSIARLMETG